MSTAPWIVCAWHTPDYRAWACKLIASLDDRGIPHDIVEVPKLPGSWEANTLAKPAHLLAAMDRHPDKGGRGKKGIAAIQFGISKQMLSFARTVLAYSRQLAEDVRDGPLSVDAAYRQVMQATGKNSNDRVRLRDVDCLVCGDLSPLAEIGGDVGFYMRTKWRRSGGMRYGARSGTIIVRPTPGARAYVEVWEDAAREAPWGDVDQTAQMFAMGRVPWCSFTMLPVEFCATAGDKVPLPVILHDSASRGVRKIGRWQRRLRRLASAFWKGIRQGYT